MTIVKRTGFTPADLKQQIAGLGKLQLNVGWFPSAVYPDGAPVAGTMAVQEFGTADGSIPPRAPMRITQVNYKSEWDKVVETLSARMLAGKMTIEQAADFIGMTVVADIQKTLSSNLGPELAKSTKYSRKHRLQPNSSEKTLVDTRVAFNTLSFNTEKLS